MALPIGDTRKRMSLCNLPIPINLRQIVSQPLGHPPFPIGTSVPPHDSFRCISCQLANKNFAYAKIKGDGHVYLVRFRGFAHCGFRPYHQMKVFGHPAKPNDRHGDFECQNETYPSPYQLAGISGSSRSSRDARQPFCKSIARAQPSPPD